MPSKFKINTPLPQSLPKECDKAARIFRSFVDNKNQGLDGVIPRHVLEQAKGFAIFSVFKAGFIFSARGGSGIVIAKLPNGKWAAPSAIGTAGMGFGGQAGAEVTDFLVVLNSQSAVKSFMAAGSLTLGGNMSIALGPLGRNGEASSSVNTNGNLAAMYSYSKTKGLFGGLSIEGSVIVERQDANAIAYGSSVTVKMLLSGVVTPPPWTDDLIHTLEKCTGLPGGQAWIEDAPQTGLAQEYAFGGLGSPGSEVKKSKKSKSISSFPPPSWGTRKDTGSYFDSADQDYGVSPPYATRRESPDPPSVDSVKFPVHFESEDIVNPRMITTHKQPNLLEDELSLDPPSATQSSKFPLSRSSTLTSSWRTSDPFLADEPQPEPYGTPSHVRSESSPISKSSISADAQYANLVRAVAEHDFKAIEPGDLGFNKGEIIIIIEKSDKTEDWWTGFIGGRKGIFPANFVRLL